MIKNFSEGLLNYAREKILILFSKYSIPRWTVFFMDNLAVFLVFLLAYLLRYNFEFTAINPSVAVYHALIATIVYAYFSLVFRSYAELLRHTTLIDIMQVFLVTLCSAFSLISLSIIARTLHWGAYFTLPFSVILIHYVSITVVLFSIRIFIKIIFRMVTNPNDKGTNVLIYGAGELGCAVKRVITSDPRYGYSVAGFIDNNKKLFGKTINGISVFTENILSSDFISKKKIESLIIADPKIEIVKKSRIIRTAVNLGLEVLETPEVDKWLNGQLNNGNLQKVKLEDLLGRHPIKLNMNMIKEGLNHKTILITGAAGSIGSEIARQLARFNSKKVILVDQAETPMFYIGNELREKFIDTNFKIILADVTNREKMELIFREFHPEIIFHAAAYKHVPLMEKNPHEAVRINIGGTRIVTDLALKYKAEKFVMISTDKSVNPTSVMGASKRICEELVQASSQLHVNQSTQFIITRFGNVLGSNGSVIPLFTKQIQEGGPVTVTHPDIYRYFMTIPEACQLVLEAGFMGNGGEIFVFDMGEPVRILDLANSMILLSGYVPGKDIKISFSGLRPGEKLYEELLTDKETTLPTHHPKIKKARVEKFNAPVVLEKVDQLLQNLYSLTDHDVIKLINELVPEYINHYQEEPTLKLTRKRAGAKEEIVKTDMKNEIKPQIKS